MDGNLLRLLAKDVESAASGSMALNWHIADVLGEIPAHTIRTIGFDYEWYRGPNDYSLRRAKDSEGRSCETWHPEQRTTSIDAAFKLIPENHTIQLSDWEDESLRACGAWQAIILPMGSRDKLDQLTFTNRCDHAATAALAITAASLRAICVIHEA